MKNQLVVEHGLAYIKVLRPYKKVNVISIVPYKNATGDIVPKGVPIRLTRLEAAKLVANGTHRYTGKGKLKSFLNKTMKIIKNNRELEKYDFKDKKAGHFMFTDPHTKKTYAAIKKGEKEIIMQHKEEVDPNTGKQKEFKTNHNLFELRVARFPSY